MAMKIRLARGGSKKRPFYRIVAADSRMPRDGRFIEKLGTYNPLLPKDSEERVKMDIERVQYWLGQGAQPTDRVARMLEAAGRRRKKPSATTPRRPSRARKPRSAPKRKPPRPPPPPKPLPPPPKKHLPRKHLSRKHLSRKHLPRRHLLKRHLLKRPPLKRLRKKKPPPSNRVASACGQHSLHGCERGGLSQAGRVSAPG